MRRRIAVLALAALYAAPAQAQTQSGGIQGTVTSETGAPLELVTVVASGPALQQPQTEFTDGSGQYYLSSLPPGMYSMVFLYGNAKVRRENVEVSVGKVTVVPARVDTTAAEEIVIKVKAPAIDSGSTKLGTTMKQDALKNIPNQGRTFQAVLSSAAGSQGDALGESFSGSTSIENTYVVDGINTTGLTAGGVGLPVINNFIQEVEVITGGYNAEFGRSTGGVVNVVTKTGSNEFHGSVWGNWQPFEATRDKTSTASSAIGRQDSLDRNVDFGFELGGPIVKDRVWFYVGFAPLLQRTKTERITGTRVDRNIRGFDYGDPNCSRNSDGSCDGDRDPATSSKGGCELTGTCESDNRADVDPATGFALVEEIDRQNWFQTINQYQFTGKLNFAVSPDHQGQVSLTGTPSVSTLVNGVAGTETAELSRVNQLTTDAALKWTSKLAGNKLQIDAVVGWHRDKQDAKSVNDTLPNDPTMRSAETPTHQIVGTDTSFANLGVLGNNRDVPESMQTRQFCEDGGPGDAFPGIVNCPVSLYNMNSIGAITDQLESRLTGKLTLTQRLNALGHHQLKAGADFEDNRLNARQNYTGGSFVQSFADWEITKYVKIDPNGKDVCGYNGDGSARMCDYLNDGIPVHGQTFNWAAFLQDSWSILPNLTVNAGLRYEQQSLRYADELKNVLDPVTGHTIGSTAVHLTDLVAPRLGAIYDWTKEGRSKVYASFGRFYESIPMDINLRSFGGEQQYSSYWDWEQQCGNPSSDSKDPALPSRPENCPAPSADGSVAPAFGDFLLGANDDAYGIPAGVTLVSPGLKAQYMDELIVGVEYEVLEDLRLGASFQNRRLGRIIEDVSPDGGTTFLLANPGEFSADAEAELEAQIAAMPSDSLAREQLQNRLALFKGVRNYDKPSRRYNALQLTASKRFSKSFMVQGSYTYSVLRGNFPGLFSPDSGQVDPNITSQYDLIELLSNRTGPLPHDRPHNFKVDGYYTFDLQKAGRVTAGARVRAQSGIPRQTLGRHGTYGRFESFLLPRGTVGRTDMTANTDLHVAYGRHLGGTMDLEVFFEVFNVLNSQQQTTTDDEYTQDVVDPIVGGTEADLPYAKIIGAAPGTTVRKKLNYGNTTTRNLPMSARFGVTLSF